MSYQNACGYCGVCVRSNVDFAEQEKNVLESCAHSIAMLRAATGCLVGGIVATAGFGRDPPTASIARS